MDLTGAGTAIMVAVAALLWFLYFVPTWMARREYLDTERTATRLQQTLRIMAETAEAPEQVRIEVSAREASRQERILLAQRKAEDRRADAMAAQAAAAVRAATPPAAARTAAAVSWSRAEPTVSAADSARLRRRRAHRLASILMIAATVVIGVQLWLVMTTGIEIGSWVVFAAAAGLGVAGVTVRRRVDARRAPRAVANPRPTEVRDVRVIVEAPAAEASGWTPIPVPAPLYLSKPEVQRVAPAPDLAAQLRAAALASEEALRAAHAEPEVVPIADAPSRKAPAAQTASRWAAMGRMSESPDAATPDLDEVLRRRRNAG
jgi:hypothetical protein